ncbi:unnamed protein product [Spirodela intermedia]|uniref:Uncharacterized protein n=1 Tax=Spirodela intermedia TaxID=51605 RepID=A0A7I8LKK6_SPIIN|nr:unnamed protein product [Spirodela intermedia]
MAWKILQASSSMPACAQAERTPMKVTSLGLHSPRSISRNRERALSASPCLARPPIMAVKDITFRRSKPSNTLQASSTSPHLEYMEMSELQTP